MHLPTRPRHQQTPSVTRGWRSHRAGQGLCYIRVAVTHGAGAGRAQAATGQVSREPPGAPAAVRSGACCFVSSVGFYFCGFCFFASAKGSPAGAGAESVSTILRYLLLCANPEGRDVREGTAVQRGRGEGGGAGGVVDCCALVPT